MFKLESYVTPYILAYLGKYFKNFDPADFQMSLWGGGALFQNLNLDLQVLDEELNLPVTFVSGHIHGLRISVPWTKVTSEPIQVHVNTIEVTLRLKRLDGSTEEEEDEEEDRTEISATFSPTSLSQLGGNSSPPPAATSPPSGYMQGIIAKILNNVHVTFENVIVKYMEEDIVLSLNIKKATYATVDDNWVGAFIDLSSPDFALRKKFQFQDLTICLDQANTSGKIETYQEPFLYRCAFEIRILQMFKSALSKTASFTRMDFHFDEMHFSITDEQVPMLIRLNMLIQSLLYINLASIPLSTSEGEPISRRSKLPSLKSNNYHRHSNNCKVSEDVSDNPDEESSGWGAWAMSWLPPLATFLGDEYEEGDEEEQQERGSGGTFLPSRSSDTLADHDQSSSRLICHYGFFVNKINVKFKALERTVRDGRSGRVKFLPFMKLHFQGVVGNSVFRGEESNKRFGISYISLIPEGFCPCGIVDGEQSGDQVGSRINQYLQMGQTNGDYVKDSMFVKGWTASDFNYGFEYKEHTKNYTVEAMLLKTPAIGIDYLHSISRVEYEGTAQSQTSSQSNNEDGGNSSTEWVDLGRDKLLVRMVVASATLSVSSGFIHRLKLISYAIDNYSYEPYGEIHRLMNTSPILENTPRLAMPLDFSIYRNVENARDSYQLTIIEPKIEIWAADHPEYDFESRDKHLGQKRRIRSTTPFSQVMPNWPKIVISAQTMWVVGAEGNLRLRALIARAIEGSIGIPHLPKELVQGCKSERSVMVEKARLDLNTGNLTIGIIKESDVQWEQGRLERGDIFIDDEIPVEENKFTTDWLSASATWMELTLCHIIVESMVQNVERYSEHLTTSSLLVDLPNDRGSRLVLNICDFNAAHVQTKKYTSSKLMVARIEVSLEGCGLSEALRIFTGPNSLGSTSTHKLNRVAKDQMLLLAIAQYPKDEDNEPATSAGHHDAPLTPPPHRHTPPHLGIIHKIRPPNPPAGSIPPVFVLHIAPYKITYHNKILDWMQYSPLTHPSVITQEVRMAREIKVPLCPHSCNSSRDGSSRKSFSRQVEGLLQCGQQPDGTESSSWTPSSRAGSTTSSLPGYQLPPFQKKHIDAQDSITHQDNAVVVGDGWEHWIVSWLSRMDKGSLVISVDFGELWFPLKPSHQSSNKAEYVLFVAPKVGIAPPNPNSPRGGKHGKDEGVAFMPLSAITEWSKMELPICSRNKDENETNLPLNLVFGEMYFATVNNDDVEQDLCCEKLSIAVTCSLSKREGDEGGYTTACIHADVRNVRVSLTWKHMWAVTKLLDEIFLASTRYCSLPSFLPLPPDDGELLQFTPISPQEIGGSGSIHSNCESKSSDHGGGAASSSAPFAPGHTPSTHSTGRRTPKIHTPAQPQSVPRELDDFSVSSSFGGGGGGLTPTTTQKSSQGRKRLPELKASLWVQATVGSVCVSLTSQEGEIGNKPQYRITLELEDILTSLDLQSIYIKFGHKMGHIRILNYAWDPVSGGWKAGESLGVIVSSGDHITRDISQHQGSFNKDKDANTGGGTFTPRTSHPLNPPPLQKGTIAGFPPQPESQQAQKHNAFTLTFTRVLCSNVHLKAGLITSPWRKWVVALEKVVTMETERGTGRSDFTELTLLDEEDDRSLSEIDIVLKGLDIVLNPKVFEPFEDIADGVREVLKKNYSGDRIGEDEDKGEGAGIPALNNYTVPLIYVETSGLRLFVKGETKNTRNKYKSYVPDFILLECSKVKVDSHNDYPLHRTIVSPLVFHLGQKTRILEIPGSPVEDRQYQITISGLTASTGFWKDVATRSKKHMMRSSLMLKTQGENPALEWNIRTTDYTPEDVATYPLLERVEITLALAPAMVYSRVGGDPVMSQVVAGHAAQLNLLSDIKISMNVDQLECLKQVGDQVTMVMMGAKSFVDELSSLEAGVVEVKEDVGRWESVMGVGNDDVVLVMEEEEEVPIVSGDKRQNVSPGGRDSGVDSSLSHSVRFESPHGTPTSSTRLIFKNKGGVAPSSTSRSREAVPKQKKKKGLSATSTTVTTTKLEMVPADFLLACGIIRITIYDAKYNLTGDVDTVVPLVAIMAIQPHLIFSVSQHFQKFEVSLFELCVQLGSKEIESSWIPDLSSFDQNLFESIRGERDLKTGIVPPLLNLKIVDFINRPCTVLCDIKRPIRLEMSHTKLSTLLHVLPFLFDQGGSALRMKIGRTKIISAADIVEQNRKRQTEVRLFLGKMSSVGVTCSQLVLTLVEEAAALTFSFGAASLKASIKRSGTGCGEEAEMVQATLAVEGIAVTSMFKERSSMLVNAFNGGMDVKCGWTQDLDYPVMIVSMQLDPVSVWMGPQNILCIQQIHSVFKEYLDELTIVEEEIIDIMEQYEPTRAKMICDSYEDDLRAGSFQFVRIEGTRSTSASATPSTAWTGHPLPEVYQIVFNQKERSMTWRYPQPRVLTCVEASPVPLLGEEEGHNMGSIGIMGHTTTTTELDCVVEYWDEAMCDFRHFGSFILSEMNGGRCGSVPKAKLHMFNASTWRIRILTGLKDSECKHLVRPEILAACVKVDSIHDTSLTAKLKLYLELPRVQVHLVNNFYFAGTGPSSVIPSYSLNSEPSPFFQHDQIFGTLSFHSNSTLLSVWSKHASVEFNGFFEMQVLDYEFLTMTPLLLPSLFNVHLNMWEPPHSVRIHSEVELFWKEIEVRVGASLLHTLTTSGTLWRQLLSAWDGKRIRMWEDKSKMESVNVNQILVLNTLPGEIRFRQSGSDASLYVGSCSVQPFFWATNKSKAVCKVGVKEKEWTFCCSFDLKKGGYIVRSVGQRVLFIHVGMVGGMQRLVTISGALVVASALFKSIQVAVLPTNKSVESCWIVPKDGYGSSQMLNLGEIEHFRFRIVSEGADGTPSDPPPLQQPWSGIVTPTELRAKNTVELKLFEEVNGTLCTLCVWVSLLVETVEETERCLVVLCPYFRVQSFLPNETWVNVMPAKGQDGKKMKKEYLLKGMGQELEIEFTQGHDMVHHLTLQTSPVSSASTPTIPLLPEGPLLKLETVSRPIDQVLSSITSVGFGSSCSDGVPPIPPNNGQEKWPFIDENIDLTEWNGCNQPKTDLEVEFTPWIEGLPTVRLQFKPWALIVNLTSEDVYFGQWLTSGANEEDEISFLIPSQAVFSPTKMAFNEGRLRFGVELGGELLLSEKLRLSEDQRRTDIHHANLDDVLPMDSISRLDLLSRQGLHQIGHITIETRLKEKIILFILRPTFSLVNNSGATLFAQSIALSNTTTHQTRGVWTEEKLSSYSYSLPSQTKVEGEPPRATPLLRFVTDKPDYAPHDKSVKYLAISCPGGPWWFVQLMDFRLIFDNMNSSQGLLAASITVNVPMKRAGYIKSNTRMLEDVEFESVTLPLVISWTSKNGQVWISLNNEPCPQLVLHNSTEVPFLFVQGVGLAGRAEALQETEGFEQYLVLPPNCKGCYTFPKKFGDGGTEIGTLGGSLPNLLITKLPQDLKDIMSAYPLSPSSSTVLGGKGCGSDNDFGTELRRQTRKYRARRKKKMNEQVEEEEVVENEETQEILKPCGTMLVPGPGLSWSKVLKVDGERSQYFCVGEFVDAKISIEKIGFSFYIFIEYMSGVEVAAKDVRRRIAGGTPTSTSCSPSTSSTSLAVVGITTPTRIPHPGNLLPLPFKSLPSSAVQVGSLNSQSNELYSAIDADDPHTRQNKTTAAAPAFQLHAYLPKVTLVVIHDVPSAMERRQLLSITMEDVLLEQIPILDDTRYRALFDRRKGCFERRECYTISLQVGDIQVDSPCTEGELMADFPVILKQKDEYQEAQSRGNNMGSGVDKVSWRRYKMLRELQSPDFRPMVNLSLTYGQSSLTHRSMESVSLSVKPFFLNVEDRLLDVVGPSLLSLHALVEDQLLLSLKVQYEKNRTSRAPASSFSEDFTRDLDLTTLQVPSSIWNLLLSISAPLLISSISLDELELCVTLRIAKPFYLAVDHSRVKIASFSRSSCVTTGYHLGLSVSTHYTSGALFQVGNPVRLLGSLELLGSPGSLVETVGGGLKDFVVYPYQGMFMGPTGFVTGVGHGVSSLVKSITSGTLTSVTNWAWSMSRNIDKLTLDEEEQFLSEANRRVQLEGWTDGLLQGLTGFGIRLLGAIGGIAHHPIQNMMAGGSSPPMAVLQGVSRGVVGMVTRPIGGIVELVAMTGQGVLRSAGWTPQFKPKGEPLVENVWGRVNGLLKYQLSLIEQQRVDNERFILLMDACQTVGDEVMVVQGPSRAKTLKHKAVSLLLSNLNLYIIDVTEDLSVSHFPVTLLTSEMSEDRTLIRLKTVPATRTRARDDVAFVKERIMNFVASSAAVNPVVVGSSSLQVGGVVMSIPSEGIFTPATSATFLATLPPSPSQRRRDTPVPPERDSSIRILFPPAHSHPPTTHPSGTSEGGEFRDALVGTLSDVASTPMYTAFGGAGGSSVGGESSSARGGGGGGGGERVESPPLESIWVGGGGGVGVSGGGGDRVGCFLLSPHDKQEFENVLAWLQRNADGAQYFNVQV